MDHFRIPKLCIALIIDVLMCNYFNTAEDKGGGNFNYTYYYYCILVISDFLYY